MSGTIGGLTPAQLPLTGNELIELEQSEASVRATVQDFLTFTTGGVRVTLNDTVAGVLNDKLIAGNNITSTINNPGSNESITLNAADPTVQVTGADTTPNFLAPKIVAGSDILLTVLNPGGDETLRIDATGASANNAVSVTIADTTPGFLASKMIAGSNITLTVNNPGGNETLTIDSIGENKHLVTTSSRISTITLSDEADLSGFSLLANTFYKVEGFLHFTNSLPTGGFRWFLEFSAANQQTSVNYFSTNQSGTVVADAISDEVVTGTLVPTSTMFQISGGFLTNAVTAPTLDFQWAQNVSDPTPTNLQRGSWIKITPMT